MGEKEEGKRVRVKREGRRMRIKGEGRKRAG